MRRKSMNSSTAHHEAAHAVMAWYAGAMIGTVTIEHNHDGGWAGYVQHGDNDAEPGDIGIRFLPHPEHGLIAQDLEGESNYWRSTTEAEREHYSLTVQFMDIRWWQKNALICAAGSAAEIIVAPEQYNPLGSSSDRRNTEEHLPPGQTWEMWLERAGEFLSIPAVWCRVEALALELAKVPTLESDRVLEIIREAC